MVNCETKITFGSTLQRVRIARRILLLIFYMPETLPISFNRIYCFFPSCFTAAIHIHRKNFRKFKKPQRRRGGVSHNSIPQRELPLTHSGTLCSLPLSVCTNLFFTFLKQNLDHTMGIVFGSVFTGFTS